MHNPHQQHSLIAQTHSSAPLALASSLQEMASSPTLTINEAVAARRAAGRKTIHLGFGEASFPLHPQLNEAMARAAKHTGYAPVPGIPSLRKSIAAYLERTRHLAFTPDQIIVAPGSKPLLYTLLQVLEGDLLLPVPSWVSYAPHARLAGRRVIPVETDASDHHRLTPDMLSETLTRARFEGANPRILIVNTPSNPTGSMFTGEDTQAIAPMVTRTRHHAHQRRDIRGTRARLARACLPRAILPRRLHCNRRPLKSILGWRLAARLRRAPRRCGRQTTDGLATRPRQRNLVVRHHPGARSRRRRL